METEYLKSISICPETALEKRGGREPRSDRGKIHFSLVTQNGDVKIKSTWQLQEPLQVNLRSHSSSCALFHFPSHQQLLPKTLGVRRAFKDRNYWNVKTTVATHCTWARAATSGAFLQRRSPSKIPDSSRTFTRTRDHLKGKHIMGYFYTHWKGGKVRLYRQAYAT